MKLTSTRLEILNTYIDKWMELPRTKRINVADQVCDVMIELGLDELLKPLDICFSKSGDIEKDMRTRQQMFFRWLGRYLESKKQTDKLFYIEQAIVAAMPQEIRISYLNAVYSVADIYVGARNREDGQILDIGTVTASLIKESSEAQVALINLQSKPSRRAAEKAFKELDDHIGQGIAAQNTLKEEFGLEMKNRQTSFTRTGKAVSTNAQSNIQRILGL